MAAAKRKNNYGNSACCFFFLRSKLLTTGLAAAAASSGQSVRIDRLRRRGGGRDSGRIRRYPVTPTDFDEGLSSVSTTDMAFLKDDSLDIIWPCSGSKLTTYVRICETCSQEARAMKQVRLSSREAFVPT